MLTPGQLVLIHEIARQPSLARAAAVLGLTASAISQQVARLERDVGAAVVERGARGASLTELGLLLAVDGAVVAEATGRAAGVVEAFLGTTSGRLRVGSLASAVVPLVAEALAHLRLHRSDADLSVVEVGSDSGLDGVRASALDVAVVADYGQLDGVPGITRHPLVEDPYLAVVPERHRLATRGRPVAIADLADDPWVSGAPGRPHRTQQDLVAAQHDVDPRVAFETESYEFAQAMVAAGTAIAVVPRLAWHGLPGTVALDLAGTPGRTLVAVTPERSEHLSLLPSFLSALRETADEA